MRNLIGLSLALLGTSFWIRPAALLADDADLSEQIRALSSEDDDVRFDAIYELREMGIAARDAQPALIGLLDNPDEYVRAAAADALLRVGGDVDLVLPLLEDSEQSVLLSVARSVLVDGRKPAAAIPVLVFLASEGDDWVDADETFEAFSASLARKTARGLLEVVETEDESGIRSRAWYALQKMDAIGPEHVPLLESLLRHPKDDVRKIAAERLAWLQQDAESAIPALRNALSDDAPIVRVEAALTLLSFNETRAMAIDVLRAEMEDGSRDARLAAIEGLRFVDAPELIPQLIAGLADQDRRIVGWRSDITITSLGATVVPDLVQTVQRRNDDQYVDYRWDAIARVLGEFGAESADALEALLILSNDANPNVQASAAGGLGRIAVKSEAVTTRLVELLDSPNAEVRKAAVESLRSTTPPTGFETVRAALRNRLQDDDPHVRVAAARSLGGLGVEAGVYLPVLEELLEDEDGTVVEDVLNAYEELGALGAPSIPELVGALNTDAAVSAGFSGYALNQSVPRVFGTIGRPAVPALIAVLGHHDPLVRGHAAESLGLIGADAAPGVPALLEHLADEGEFPASMGCMGFQRTVGAVAAEALGEIGPSAKQAVPDLLKRLEEITRPDWYPEDVALTARALGGIGPDAADALPLLWELAENGGSWERSEALIALARIERDHPKVIAAMIDFLLQIARDDPLAEFSSVTLVAEVTDGAVEMGDAARPLIPTLEYLIEDAPLLYPLYRCDAAAALARIDPDNPLPEQFLRRQARIEQVSGDMIDWAQQTLQQMHDDPPPF